MACNKILKVLLLFILILLTNKALSQQLSIIEKVKRANYAEIYFLKAKLPYVYKTKRKIDLICLKTLITAAKDDPGLKCDTTGMIIYFKDKVGLARIFFSSRGTGSKYNFIGVIAFKINERNITSKLNYGTAMLVNEVFYSLQKSK